MMTKSVLCLLSVLSIAACSRDRSDAVAKSDNGPLADSAVRTTGAGASIAGTLPKGTVVNASIQQQVSSATNSKGDPVRAFVTKNVVDSAGHVVIPGGSSVVFTIAQLGPARAGGSTAGSLTLSLSAITVGTVKYVPRASVGSVPHTLMGESANGGKDVVVGPGTPVTITFTEPLKISAN